MNKYIPFIALVVLVLGIQPMRAQAPDNSFEITKNLDIFTNVYKELNTRFVDQLDPDRMMKIGIDAMLHSLDPYTRYYSENQIERYRFLIEGKYDGIGADVKIIDDQVTIMEVFKGFGADAAGLKAGDRILEIDGRAMKGITIDEVKSMLRGLDGAPLDLQVQQMGGQTKPITVVRSAVNESNVPYSGMADPETGYIVLSTFTINAANNILIAFKQLKKEHPNMKYLILDLRNNGGGLLHEAIHICNLFLPADEVLVTTKNKTPGDVKIYKTEKPPLDLEIPLVVLVNNRSASASEIVSGVMQDMDRGVVLGQRTYGKGLVQNTKKMGYHTNLKLTTAKYYIPSDRCIQAVEYENGEPVDIPDSLRAVFYTRNGREVRDGGGVKPDVFIPVPDVPEVVEALEDQHIIFRYVNAYVAKHPNIASAESYTFDDYGGFKNFVKQSGFSYVSKTDSYLQKMRELNPTNKISKEIEQLQKLVENEKKDELDRYQSIIQPILEDAIVTRYYYKAGRIKHSMQSDKELQAAIELLKDQPRYQSILK